MQSIEKTKEICEKSIDKCKKLSIIVIVSDDSVVT